MQNNPFDRALEIISEKGSDIMSADLHEIEHLMTLFDVDKAAELQGAIYEALALIVNDPNYDGDIPPID
jgi:hypothetical protein